jgi:two-component system sensor histidine kinase QseC
MRRSSRRAGWEPSPATPWEKLIAGGGKPVQCGWLKDRFGVSWQVVPAGIMQLYSDSRTAPRVMQAMLKMVKLDMQELKEAAK